MLWSNEVQSFIRCLEIKSIHCLMPAGVSPDLLPSIVGGHLSKHLPPQKKKDEKSKDQQRHPKIFLLTLPQSITVLEGNFKISPY